MDKQDEKRLEQLSAFEVSARMLALAKQNQHSNVFLNAGRGNPNWINTQARLAFNRLVAFGVAESRRTLDQGNLAGYVETAGIAARLQTFLHPQTDTTDAFLVASLAYLQQLIGGAQDPVVAELINGALGNNYPGPNRVLKYTEQILNAYLAATLYRDQTDLAQTTQLFPTEGGTAAIVYLFHSLAENHLLQPGDRIAINTPIFTPYLEIPELNDYELVEVDLRSREQDQWELRAAELTKLADPTIKALILVNPSNPGSKALDPAALAGIKAAVAKNPNLLIITDDVYGTFVPNFQTVYAVAPHNTILVYSFSKLFGATGWRLGLIGLNTDNICDRHLAALGANTQAALARRYGSVTLDCSHFRFINRIVADSRSVGLYHTAGLSTPQQIMADLFALTHLVASAGSSDPYIEQARQLVARRYHDLHQSLGVPEDDSATAAKYYSLIDIYQLAEQRYGRAFRDYLADRFEPVDFLLNLSQKNGVVLMDGVGFGSKAGELRVSQANLPTADYQKIGQQVLELLGEYHQRYLKVRG